ncbi:unnamed protein product [Clonostachys byssicola]|uniref:Ankyrin repeat domain-containing protein n=1 Tax=Clonostachys byssicola TaxID=160290 RepID=A0A9N9U6I7_9HYPO|nr:unnamed protein product [Clonostachys byssicola]
MSVSQIISKEDQTAKSTTDEARKTISERLGLKKFSPSHSKDAEESLESKITDLHLAAEDENLARVEEILLSDKSTIDFQTNEGMSALAIAARHGSANVVQSLLKENPTLKLRNQNGMTALHLAAQNGNENIVKQLLLAGDFEKTDPELSSLISNVNVLDDSSRTPLFLASERGNASVVDLLLNSGADCRLPDKRGITPLEIAALSGKEEVTKLLKPSGSMEERYWIELSSDKNLDLGMLVADRSGMQQVGTHVAPPEELLGTTRASGFRATLDEVEKGHYGDWAKVIGRRLANKLEVEAFEDMLFDPSDEYLAAITETIRNKFRWSFYMVTGMKLARISGVEANKASISPMSREKEPSQPAKILIAVELDKVIFMGPSVMKTILLRGRQKPRKTAFTFK